MILVYDIAASSSGALGVLESYYARALRSQGKYCFLVSTPNLLSSRNVEVLRFPWVKKSWFHRLFFDWIIAPKLLKKLQPDRILSLQNTTMPLTRIPQTVYEHNALPKPFCDFRFKLFEEPTLWVRQNVLGSLIVRSLKKADCVIVQSEWMKDRCVKTLGIDSSNVTVEQPVVESMPSVEYSASVPITFFYPATAFSFKNHDVIVEACCLLKDTVHNASFKVLFTLAGNESDHMLQLRKKVETKKIPIEFIGWQSPESMWKLYSKCALIFPSSVESFPLPLYEAMHAGSPIVAPKLQYASEALAGYKRVSFFQVNSPDSLAQSMFYVIAGKESKNDAVDCG